MPAKVLQEKKDYTDVDGLITKCTGNLSGDILRGLCTASVSGSGEKGGSIQPFRLERHCEPDGTGDG